jgi:TonB family protein
MEGISLVPIPNRVWRAIILALAFLQSPWASLPGQEALYVQNGSGASLVLAAREGFPLILEDGKLVDAPTHRYALRKVPEYSPQFVEIQGLRVVNSYIDDGGAGKNRQLEFYGKFVSPYALPHVFLVLEVYSEKEPRMIFLREIGTMVPHKRESMLLVIPIRGDFGEAHYQVHVFSDGREILHSLMDPAERTRIMDALVAKRTRGAPDRGPQAFAGPPPEYPKTLHRAKVSGRAIVRVHIDERGEPLNPRVVSATDPAFGDAALEAIRLWRFLPPVRDGAAIAVDVNVPFGFKP